MTLKNIINIIKTIDIFSFTRKEKSNHGHVLLVNVSIGRYHESLEQDCDDSKLIVLRKKTILCLKPRYFKEFLSMRSDKKRKLYTYPLQYEFF